MAKISRKGLKICCGITALIILILIVVAVVLYFTIFKPKQPKITTQSVTLENFKYFPFPFFLNATFGLVVSIDNPNYGSYTYQNSTTYVTYRGINVAEASIENDTIPARGKHDIETTVVVQVDKIVADPSDIFTQNFNFSSSTTLHGKATVLKFLKIKATSYSTCDIYLVTSTQNVTAVCKSKLKF